MSAEPLRAKDGAGQRCVWASTESRVYFRIQNISLFLRISDGIITIRYERPTRPPAARLRQRKFEILRRFSVPDDFLPGSLSLGHLR